MGEGTGTATRRSRVGSGCNRRGRASWDAGRTSDITSIASQQIFRGWVANIEIYTSLILGIAALDRRCSSLWSDVRDRQVQRSNPAPKLHSLIPLIASFLRQLYRRLCWSSWRPCAIISWPNYYWTWLLIMSKLKLVKTSCVWYRKGPTAQVSNGSGGISYKVSCCTLLSDKPHFTHNHIILVRAFVACASLLLC